MQYILYLYSTRTERMQCKAVRAQQSDQSDQSDQSQPMTDPPVQSSSPNWRNPIPLDRPSQVLKDGCTRIHHQTATCHMSYSAHTVLVQYLSSQTVTADDA
jgi:hypothetical protein